MQSDWSPLGVAIAAYGAVAVVLLGVALASVWIFRSFFGEQSYSAATLVVAVVGAVVAVVQAGTPGRQASEAQAVTLSFVSRLLHDEVGLVSRPVPQGQVGEIANPYVLSKDLTKARLGRFRAISAALDAVDAKSLPSSVSMSELVRARSAARDIVTFAEDLVAHGADADFKALLPDLITAVSRLDAEINRLYPIHQIGSFGFSFRSPNSF